MTDESDGGRSETGAVAARHRRGGAAPRVLHVIAPAAFGGLEQVVVQLAQGRAARGAPTEVLALVAEGSADPPVAEVLARAAVRTELQRSAHRAYRREQRAIQAAAEKFGAHVVHTHGYRPDVLGLGPARRAGSGLVSTAHGFTGGGAKNRLFEWLQRRAWRSFDVVAAVSRPLRERLVRSGVPESVVELCPNAWSGVEPLDRLSARSHLGLPEDARLVGWVGRLSREKGPDVMVRALAQLPRDVGAVMIGDGPEREALSRLAADLGVSERIFWPGSLQGAGRYMAAFDAFALSSRTEGTPIVLFEAMAASVPIVATSVGGVPDVVSRAEAVLVRPDSAEEFAGGLTQALSAMHDPAARPKAARRRLEQQYAPGPWLDRYEELYVRAAGVRR